MLGDQFGKALISNPEKMKVSMTTNSANITKDNGFTLMGFF